ncbi:MULTISPECIES: M15 family metallopeptidase [unclassified Dyella]|uniref:M15 family metallopeptidase n=1 Tax=unclassified Dyella TaxID=2634549 RepID=UPI003F91B59A
MPGVALLALVALAHADGAPRLSPATTAAQAGLVDIRRLAPDIAEDIKYAGSDNFVGKPVDGYLAPKCLLLKPAAEALARVEHDLHAQHQRLKLFDCYRPARAVQHFVRWAGELNDQRTKATHYPKLDKSALLGDYIAPVSGHSRGATVDLTLMQCDVTDSHCAPLDMGTDFDYFGTLANTDSPEANAAQHANREILKRAMEREGFRNYAMEWWHYTLSPEPSPDTVYDVPVQ